MVILSNTGGIAMTNSFLIADETLKQAVVMDAPDHTVGRLLQEASKRGWEVTGLWLTHGHFDHFADHTEVKKHFPAVRILIHPADEPKAQHPEIQTRLFGLPLTIQPLKPDAHVEEGQQLQIGSIPVEVIHTPGHSPGHVCYHLPTEQVLIGGDLIIGGSVGRTDLPDSDHAELQASIRKVMRLPPATRLLGGHGDPTTLGYERDNNPFVQEALG
jgi:hydroxyacylglutathione hydrolase